MGELWQAYGSWVLWAGFVVLMVGHHLLMGRGGHAAGQGRHAHDPEDDAAASDDRSRRHGGGCH